MAPVSERPKPQHAAPPTIPFRLRLKAWWEGNELYVRRRERESLRPGDKDTLKRQRAQTGDPDPERPWDTPRVRLLQAVWSEGFCTPGGRDAILDLVKPFGLDPTMSILHLGAGLGGPARAFAEEFGVWVTGLESDHELAEAGMALAALAGMAKKAEIRPFDLQNTVFPSNEFDAVLASEIFFAIADKRRFLISLEEGLKQRGQLLFTDYALRRRASEDHPAIRAWAEVEPVPPRPWTADEYIQVLNELKLDIRVTEDVTASFREQVIHAWSDYTGAVATADLDPATARCLVREVDLWTRRIAAIDSGELRLYRIYALKKVAEKMLSDW